ncbi:MAG: helix-turn-helix domain-containing protein, partial [Alphaproteobacteria bacterium]|nr:helix-turn-helix domain-containing protein [Alphaproteobacteria bacterium]
MSENKRKTSARKPADGAENLAAARLAHAANEAAPKGRAKTERIGDILRTARLERNDDLYQIAEYLCIKPAFLVALENSRYDEFPADAYVIGFLRTYASFLGVDGKEAVDRYRYEMAGRRKKPVLAMPVPMSEGRTPSALILVGATIAALLIYALWYGISSANRTDVNAPPPLPVSQQTSPADSAAAGLTAPVAGGGGAAPPPPPPPTRPPPSPPPTHPPHPHPHTHPPP